MGTASDISLALRHRILRVIIWLPKQAPAFPTPSSEGSYSPRDQLYLPATWLALLQTWLFRVPCVPIFFAYIAMLCYPILLPSPHPFAQEVSPGIRLRRNQDILGITYHLFLSASNKEADKLLPSHSHRSGLRSSHPPCIPPQTRILPQG